MRAFFQSGSIIDAVLNFGSAAPIDVQLSGPGFDELFDTALKVHSTVQGAARGSRMRSFPRNPTIQP